MHLFKCYIFFCFITILSFAQKPLDTELQLFYNVVEDMCSANKQNKSFCKAYHFYRNQQYDSSYVYSNKAFLGILTKKERNILNYIQGVSAINKNLYKKALENIKSISKNSAFKALKLLKLGQIYLKLEEYDKAVYHYLEWEKDNILTDTILKKNAYHNLGLTYTHKRDYINAKKYFSKESNLIKEIDSLEMITTKIELANIYYNQYKDKDAIPLFKEAYSLAKLFNEIELKQNTALNMAVVEKNRKHYEKSVDYYIEYVKWKDSIWNRDKIITLAERDKQISIAHKQKEIVLRDAQLKRQKIQKKSLILGSTALIIFITFLGYFYKKVKSKNKVITTQKEELSILNITKDYLFSVVSHDLRSTVNALRKQHNKLIHQITDKDLLKVGKTANATVAMTENMHHLLNNILHWSLEQSKQLLFNKKACALQPIIQQVVFDFKNLAEAEHIKIQTILDDSILVNVDRESLKIILRNIIDNAIKYTKEKGNIKITTVAIPKNKCCITIEDSGIGISEEQLIRINKLKEISIDKIDRSKGVGLGLLLCTTLIRKNNGTLEFKSKLGKGTQIKITLPLASE